MVMVVSFHGNQKTHTTFIAFVYIFLQGKSLFPLEFLYQALEQLLIVEATSE